MQREIRLPDDVWKLKGGRFWLNYAGMWMFIILMPLLILTFLVLEATHGSKYWRAYGIAGLSFIMGYVVSFYAGLVRTETKTETGKKQIEWTSQRPKSFGIWTSIWWAGRILSFGAITAMVYFGYFAVGK
jgi:hypothetical protein